MTGHLVLRLAPDGSLSWFEPGAGVRAGVPPAAQLEAAPGITVLVPAADVLLAPVAIAARSSAQWLRALPFALEDQLLAPPEQLHLAASRRPPPGAAVVAREVLDGWLGKLAEQGVQPDALVPESLLLPFEEGTATVLLDVDGAVVRWGPWSAFACTTQELPAWLEQARASGAFKTCRVLDGRDHDLPEHALSAASGTESLPDGTLPWLAGRTPEPGLNLLQGRYVPPRRRRGAAALWRVAAGLAAGVVLLAFAVLAADTWRLGREVAQLEQDAGRLVAAALPELDPDLIRRLGAETVLRHQLESLRGSGSGSTQAGVLAMLAAVGPVLARNPRVQSRGLDWRNGTLELAVRTPDLALLDSVREQLAAVPGVQAELTRAEAGEGGVDGRIRLAGPP